MPTIDNASPIAGYYYDSATDKLRPIAGQPGPKGDPGPQGPIGPQGPGGSVAGYWSGTVGGWTFGTSVVGVNFGTPALSSGFTKIGAGQALRCDMPGLYRIVGGFTFGGTPNSWVTISFVQFRSTIQQANYSWVCGNSAGGGFGMGAPVAEFNMQLNDTFEIWLSSNNANVAFDARSTFTISPVMSTGPVGPQGPQGIPGIDGNPTKLNDLTDVTISGTPTAGQALAWDTGTSQWVPANGRIISAGRVSVDLGSQTVGGLRDLVTTNIAQQSISQVVQISAWISHGYGGAGPTTCQNIELVSLRTGGVVDGATGAVQAPTASTIRTPLSCTETIPANTSPNFKTRINGTNFSGGNCYMASAIQWISYVA